jgi:hypothetical protein
MDKKNLAKINPNAIFKLLKIIKLPSWRPLEVMSGFAVKHGDNLYIIKYRRDFKYLDKFEDPWEIVSNEEFLSGIESPTIINEEFYQNKYFIIDISNLSSIEIELCKQMINKLIT